MQGALLPGGRKTFALRGVGFDSLVRNDATTVDM